MSLTDFDDPLMRSLSALIRRECVELVPPLTPELAIWGAVPRAALWEATQETLDSYGLAPPFWPFAWPGGQALARLVLDQPGLVAGRRVASLACGGGLEALAAARSGAASVLALDCDPAAIVATEMNAQLNGLSLSAECADVLNAGVVERWISWAEVVLVGDVFYEAELADRFTTVLAQAVDAGRAVYIGDPGRGYPCALPRELIASFDIPTDIEVEGVDLLRTSVTKLLAS